MEGKGERVGRRKERRLFEGGKDGKVGEGKEGIEEGKEGRK